MKNSIKTITAIIVIIASLSSSFAKSNQMTSNQFKLKYNQVDSSLIGTWEKNKTTNTKAVNTFCQFNANGTYITFEENKGKYTVTGKGKWIVKNEKIIIVAGNEVSSTTAYISTDNYLQFNNEVAYSKPSLTYVSK
jgi:hypothetical protein